MNIQKRILHVIYLFIAITATVGGVSLIITNGLGAPLSFLSNTIFNSYFFPGILLMAVGVVNFLAFWLLMKNIAFSYEMGVCAGFGIMIFEFFEVYIIRQSHWLQIVYFFLGIFTIVLVMFLNRKK